MKEIVVVGTGAQEGCSVCGKPKATFSPYYCREHEIEVACFQAGGPQEGILAASMLLKQPSDTFGGTTQKLEVAATVAQVYAKANPVMVVQTK